jgi:transmembrane sensor
MDRDHEQSGPGGETADWEALARFLAGESSAPEADAVRGWLAESPDRQAVLSALDRAMDRGATPPPADLDVEAALARTHARMDAPETPVIPFRRPERTVQVPAAAPRRRNLTCLRAAAAVLVLLGAYFAWQVVRGGRAGTVLAYTTGVGERDSVRLPDGTRVLLGPASHLALVPGYGARSREVRLRGEALFDVPHDDARPFTVRAGAAQVRDIGTVFSVHADSGAGVRVVVTSGAVALSAARDAGADELVLRQGEGGVLAEGRSVAERTPASADDLAWTRGRLVFRDAPLAQVAAELRRWYGIELRADDAVSGRRLTASFQGESAEDVLRVIALALGAEMTTRGDTAVLHAAGAP